MMKFINKLGLTLGLLVVGLSVNVFAGENRGFFLSADAGYGHTKLLEEEFELNVKDRVSNFGLRAGYRFSSQSRVYAAYYHQSKIKDKGSFIIDVAGAISDIPIETKYRAHRIALGYDFTPMLDQNIRGVLGVYSGYSFLNAHTDSNFFGEISSLPSVFDGLMYGTKIGLLYEIGRAEVEFGVKLEQIRYKTRDLKLNFNIGGQQTEVLEQNVKPLQTTGGAYLGLNFKF